MPRYRYQCNECDRVTFEMREVAQRDELHLCGDSSGLPIPCPGQLIRQLPSISEPTVLDTVDTFRNVKHRKDQDARIRKRAKDFFVKHEMDEAIAKAGEADARKFGWLTKDGKKNK